MLLHVVTNTARHVLLKCTGMMHAHEQVLPAAQDHACRPHVPVWLLLPPQPLCLPEPLQPAPDACLGVLSDGTCVAVCTTAQKVDDQVHALVLHAFVQAIMQVHAHA